MIKMLQIVLYVTFVAYAFVYIMDIIKSIRNGKMEKENLAKPVATGFITCFMDTLGIGSFAPQVFFYKLFKQNVKDRQIPPTLNVCNTLPTMLEGIIFIQATKVEPVTLIALIAAAVVGSYLGAGIVARMDERKIQIIMGIALMIAAAMFLMSVLKILPIGGTALGLHGVKLIFAIAVFFVLGALMTAGIGLYAPAMVVVYSLGMAPTAAFPIMMGSCALLMPVASYKFIKEDSYAKKNAITMTLAGLVGVFVAYKFFQGMSMDMLKILVIVVATVTAIMMLKSAFTSKNSGKAAVQ